MLIKEQLFACKKCICSCDLKMSIRQLTLTFYIKLCGVSPAVLFVRWCLELKCLRVNVTDKLVNNTITSIFLSNEWIR